MQRSVELLTTIAALLLLSGCGKAPEAPTITGPDSCWANVPVTFRAQSTSQGSKRVAYRFGWGDGSRQKWTDHVPGTQQMSATHTYADAGLYGVTVQAMDENGRESEWSAPHPLLVKYRGVGRPNAPVGPDSGYRNTEYEFATAAEDPTGRKVRIRFDWGDGSISGWGDSVASGATATATHAFSDTGTYMIRAQAKTTEGDTSPWSHARSIAIAPGWETIMFEGFEGSFPGTRWMLIGSPTWGPEDYRKYEGRKSGWCAGSSRSAPGYSKDMYAAMVYGPFSLERADSAVVLFRSWVDTETGYDWFAWLASADGTNWDGYEVSGNFPYWELDTFDLSAVAGIGSLVGEPRVWIAFLFYSDNSVQYDGVYLDSVALMSFSGFGATKSGQAGRTSLPTPAVRPQRARVRPIHIRLAADDRSQLKLERREP
ncbi:MAG: PKD domain-containing protein [candidate division WOR-3 bacterium]